MDDETVFSPGYSFGNRQFSIRDYAALMRPHRLFRRPSSDLVSGFLQRSCTCYGVTLCFFRDMCIL